MSRLRLASRFPAWRPLALLTLALASAASAAAQQVSGRISLRLEPEILTDLGLALADVETSAPALRAGGLGFSLAAGSTLAPGAAGADLQDFAAADLRHAGGFTLVGAGAPIAFAGVRLVAEPAPHELALRDASGETWLRTTAMHAERTPDGRTLSLRHADLVIAPALAARLGRPELAESYLGLFDAELALPAPPAAARSAAAAGSCSPDFGPPVDVALIDLLGMTQLARQAGVRLALAPRALLRNVGEGDVPWNEAIAPDAPLGAHPFLALAFYRLAGGVLEQIGTNDVKHAFFATNEGCACDGGHVLFVGCEDEYGVGNNADRKYLAPRDEVGAFARSWSSLGSHFDASPVDDVRDHTYEGHDAFDHRLVVREPDLETAGARYFYDAWYLAAGDVDLPNSMGYREVDPSRSGSTWSFATVDAGLTNGSVLDVLADPASLPPGAANEWADTGEGRLQLVVTTSDAGGGLTRYAYALMNFDFERRIRSFEVPIAPGQTLAALGFDDGDADPANDWTPQLGAGAITWSAPPGAALDWGRLVGFRFDADAAPLASQARLEPQDPGAPGPLTIATLAPAAAAVPALGWGAAAALAALLLALAVRRQTM